MEFEKTAKVSVMATSLNLGTEEVRERLQSWGDRFDGHQPKSIFCVGACAKTGNGRNINPRRLKRGPLCMRAWRVVFLGGLLLFKA